MTTTEQLQRIRAKCVELLAIAEKRTQGQWKRQSIYGTAILCENSKNNGNMVCDLPDSSPECDQFSPNADFIASCAGPAEAGWKATIAAIDSIKRCSHCGGSGITDGWRPSYSDPCNSGMAKEAESCCEHIKEIITAWEGIV